MSRTFTSREFNQDASGAKRAAAEGPVFITDRGRPAHVLLTIEEYQRISGRETSLVERLTWHGAGEVELPLPAREDRARPVDLD